MMKYFWKKRGQRGFTLIELVVVLAILGILIALAVPRYLGARKQALVAEGDNALQELKTMAWAYFQQYNTFDIGGISEAVLGTSLGFQPPGTGRCWTYDLVEAGTATLISMRASNIGATPVKCSPLGATAGNSTIVVTLTNEGVSARTASIR